MTLGKPDAELDKRIALLFPPEQHEEVRTLLMEECGNNLPFQKDATPEDLKRFRFAALKLSDGTLDALHRAVRLAQRDWRDLLVAAGFATDVYAHERWTPLQRPDR